MMNSTGYKTFADLGFFVGHGYDSLPFKIVNILTIYNAGHVVSDFQHKQYTKEEMIQKCQLLYKYF